MVCFTRSRLRLLAMFVLIVSLMSGPCFALNCVQYVRQVSGMDISGDGWQWWSNAGGRFERGHVPKVKAVMVFDRSDAMEHGHVAIVSSILNPRLITINHANWARYRGMRGHVQTGVLVRDVSDKNDWSDVRVLDQPSQSFGRTNHVLGFIYDRPDQAGSLVADNNASTRAPAPPAPQAAAAVKDIDNE